MDGAQKKNITDQKWSVPGDCPQALAAAAGGEMRHSLLILSHIRFLREGLAEILARDGAFAVAGIAANVEEALVISHVVQPLITLIDAALPDGLAAARSLGKLSPHAPIVALALAETETDVIAWAEAGISGYIPCTAALEELVGFLRNILRGEQTCSTLIAGSLLRRISIATRGAAARSHATLPVLTRREEQVIRLICGGLSNKEIARRLNIGLGTTKSHVHNLLAKLELERRGQVIRWSRDQGWVRREDA
jgi:two-component system, NarL family, nitrate/nitrite response regulator NarL